MRIRMATTEIRNLIFTAASVALPLLLWFMTAPFLLAQPPAGKSPRQSTTRQAPQTLAEMAAAGVRITFDVASVKANMSDAPANSRYPLGPGDAYVPNGSFFAATNQALIAYLRFAYKLGQSDLLGLLTWVYDDRFDIEARAQGNPTKDQVRLMMQSLLTDRFNLKVHTERQIKPVFDLALAKTGKIGPQIQVHSDDGSCSTAAAQQTPSTASPATAPSSTSGLQLPPIPCDSIGPIPASATGKGRLGGRRVTIGQIAGFLTNPYTGVDRPVFDRTGLVGTYDFTLEWSLEADSAQPPGGQLNATGPTFLEALREQLGFKLKSSTGPFNVLVIDQVEHPSPN